MVDIRETLAERARTHGDFEHVAKMSQNLKHMMKSTRAFQDLDFYMAESLEAIAAKIARILSGNARELDHWRDIAGYATLAVRQIERDEMDRQMTETLGAARNIYNTVDQPENEDEQQSA